MDKVEGIGGLKGPPGARELLGKNGFVVVPRYYHQIFSPYIQEGLPAFVTTDSVHRTFHVIFEEQIKTLETHYAAEVSALTKGMLGALERMPASPERRRVRAYFAVAAKLLDDGFEPPEAVRATVEKEVAAIHAAASVAKSAVFPDYPLGIDYAQFKPRGFYTRSETLQRYFRAMSWYGNTAFRLVSDDETRAAMIIADLFLLNEDLRKKWQEIDRIYLRLIAPADDLTPEEYAEVLRVTPRHGGPAGEVLAAKAAQVLAAFKERALKLRDPKINSMVLPPALQAQWLRLTKGMRFFGKRYLPDSEMFMELTWLKVPGRMIPSGLDVLAANGCGRAEELLRADGTLAKPGYAEGLAKSRDVLAALKAADDPSHYTRFLALTETLWQTPAQAAPAFMKTKAYEDKSLTTALAAWASERHTWQLQAKQSVLYACETGQEPVGYVEPNLPFFDRLDALVGHTIDILKDVQGADIARLERFRTLAAQLRTIAGKQLAGKPLVGNETRLLQSYGPTIAGLTYFEGNSWVSDMRLPWMCLVADVHTEHLIQKTLQVATGGAMPIYVVVPSGGKQYLMVGGVYSYHEFLQPIGERLTDEAWRRWWSRGKVPAMPAWTASFVPGHDVEAMLERLRRGRQVEALLYVDDPRIVEVLKKELAPGGHFALGKNRQWAMRMYGLKAGRDAMPLLLEVLRTGPWQEKATAADVLSTVAEPGDVPTFREIAMTARDSAALYALRAMSGMSGREVQDALTDVALAAAYADARGEALGRLGSRTARGATPRLLAIYPERTDPERARIVNALAHMWSLSPPRGATEPPLPAALSEDQEKACRKQVGTLVLDALKSTNLDLLRAALRAVPMLGLDEAVPRLEEVRLREQWASPDALRALEQLDSDEACAALVRILRKPTGETGHYYSIVTTLMRKNYTPAAPAMIELLDDTRDTRTNDRRVCDLAMEALAKFDPAGPGFWKSRDDLIGNWDLQRAAWKTYLTLKDREGPYEAPAEVRELIRTLITLADNHQKSRWSFNVDQPIRWLQQAKAYLRGLAETTHGEFSPKIDGMLKQLTLREIRHFLGVMETYYRRDFGEFPPETPGYWEKVIWEKRYTRADPTRLDEKGRLCDAWGSPYRYLNPARHTKAAVEMYSFGPNRTDEDGKGDDIASWHEEGV
ncbi:MAG TPA: DUF3160 domain-containing protein [Planctomycetota bacterium]|nr:DUF3160 domain-containing protein [Planctomycetota bacterium]